MNCDIGCGNLPSLSRMKRYFGISVLEQNSRSLKKVGSKLKRRERVYKRAAQAQRDLFRKRRRRGMSAPVTFIKKSPQAIYSLRRSGGATQI